MKTAGGYRQIFAFIQSGNKIPFHLEWSKNMSTIYETLEGDENFSLLVDLIDLVDTELDAGIADALSTAELGATLLAPTNDAIINAANQLGYPDPDASGAVEYLAASLNALTDGSPAVLLGQILSFHVTPVILEEADFADPTLTSLTTLLGEDLGVSEGTLVDLDPDNPNAVPQAFTTTDNGTIVSINQLLLPADVEPDLEPTEGPDLIVGGPGNDVYDLLAGADVFSGGDGDDNVIAGDGDDLFHGGAGDDTARGGEGDDRLEGQKGDDLLFGEAGNDIIDGDQGDDRLNGGAGDDFVQGGSGDDRIAGNSGDDKLVGGSGDDRLLGRSDNDELFGGGDNDKLNAGSGDDYLEGGDGDDRMFGNSGADVMFGGEGNDRMLGRDGDDIMDGGNGNDDVNGGDGDDTVMGGDGNDRLWGGKDDDIVQGGDGNDRIAGNAGDDQLFGGAGDDRLVSREGNDSLTGGEGNDIFRLTFDNGQNVITDFDAAADTLQLAELNDEEFLDILTIDNDSGGKDVLITSSANADWSLTIENLEALDEDEIAFV
jgi:Ca2+-binding RTX toxin-like protein